jgi:alkanesulfonate monooxygenase SsuD/methylene tetrahydromethanopterin reductase-like flavin-dependent oxidoreductase (luciferase family)
MTPLSVLDLAPVVQGSTVQQALHNSRDLAQHAERWGYNRFWLAEHHNMRASPARRPASDQPCGGGHLDDPCRVRGIMLPNHAPLQIAEQFGTLDALFTVRASIWALAARRAPTS